MKPSDNSASLAAHHSIEDFTAAAAQFSDPTRVRIICLMHRFGRVSVADLRHVIDDYTQQKLFRHLNHLRRDGMLTQFRHQQTVFYSFAHTSWAFANMLTPASELAVVKKDIEKYSQLLSDRLLVASEL